MHDSECLSVEVDETGLGSVMLNAYVHRTEGEPGSSAGEGGIQRIRMRINEMTVEGELGELPAGIYEGSLTAGTLALDNMNPFPAAHTGQVRLYMMLSEDARTVEFFGQDVSIEPEGEFQFVETVDFSRR
jgi:hypothetical protein